MVFKIGQKVVCINDSLNVCHTSKLPIIKGEVYTITGFGDPDAAPCLVLAGVPNIFKEHIDLNKNYGTTYPVDIGWRADRFRPVKTTSIDVFTAMLNKQPSDLETV